MDALQVFASTKYKKEIQYLNRLFVDLVRPVVNKLYAPTGSMVTDPNDATKTIKVIDEVDAAIFAAEIKLYVQE
jgi:hypothetical protein